ncbi:ABC transporter substrate-binding protein [Nakamurella sp. A5-74]|uniref:ABC transporter substrate-binding protein n=1 Tax=Nakamurella sp. A5-74 TaxID=3158264 RepID=A0AAU8DQT7_9ACTN
MAHRLNPGTVRRLTLGSALSMALIASGCGGNDAATPSSTSPGATSSAVASSSSTAGTGAATSGSAASSGSSSGAPTSAVPEVTPAGKFTMAIATDPGSLDPSMTVLDSARTVGSLAYDPLLTYSNDGTAIPVLAESWKVSPTKIVFTLRKGVTCSDGTDFTPTDAADNINYVADAKNKSPLAGVFLDVGAKATADDSAGTLTVTVPSANIFLINNISGLFMICAAGLKDHAAIQKATIGTGAFVLKEAVAEDHYSFDRRAGYTWGAPPATPAGTPPAQVNIRVIPSATTAANLVLSGEINFAAVSGADSTRLDSAGLPTANAVRPAGETFFNEADGHVTSDPLVRQALFSGTNLEAVQKVAAAGKGGPSKGMVTLEPRGCTTDTVTGTLPAYDAAAANALLDQAGWAKGADGIRAKDGKQLALAFIYAGGGGGAGMQAASELLTAQWKQDLGVVITVKSVTSTQINEILFGTGAWDVAWLAVNVNLPVTLVPFLSGKTPADGGTNFAAIKNADYDAAVKKAAAATTVEAACESYTAAEKALFTKFDLFPMYDLYTSSYLKGATANLVGGGIDVSTVRLPG